MIRVSFGSSEIIIASLWNQTHTSGAVSSSQLNKDKLRRRGTPQLTSRENRLTTPRDSHDVRESKRWDSMFDFLS
jgi:hypothetical protein